MREVLITGLIIGGSFGVFGGAMWGISLENSRVTRRYCEFGELVLHCPQAISIKREERMK
jgi:hypothetical protein